MEQQLYELPEGWRWRALQEIASLITDGTHHSPKVQHEEPALDRYKYITSKHVKNDGLRLENVTYVDSEIHREIYARCNPEHLDQLITKDGAMTGTCCLNSLEEPFSMLSSVALVKQKRDLIQPDFLNHYLQSPVGQDQLLGDISGAAITRTNLKKLKFVPVPLPPIDEQKRIVAKLDALFNCIDAAITHLQETLELSKALFASALDDTMQTIPLGGKKTTIGEVSEKLSTGPFGSMLHQSDYVSTGLPLVNPINIVEGEIIPDDKKRISPDTAKRLAKYSLRTGDVVLARRGEIGRCAVVSEYQAGWICGTGCFFLRPSKSIDPRFLTHLVRSSTYRQELESRATGATIKNISNKILSGLKIYLPAMEEQERMISHIDALAEHTQALEAETQDRLDQLAALKSSLLDAAFRGQL